MLVKSTAECSMGGSILQYFWPALSNYWSCKHIFWSSFEWPLKTGFCVFCCMRPGRASKSSSATKTYYKIETLHGASLAKLLLREWITKALIKLFRCLGWSVSLLCACNKIRISRSKAQFALMFTHDCNACMYVTHDRHTCSLCNTWSSHMLLCNTWSNCSYKISNFLLKIS